MAQAQTTRGGRRPPPRDEPGTDLVVHPVIDDAGGVAPFLGNMLRPIARVTPKHVNPEAFIALTLAWVNRDERLLHATHANPASLVYAMRQCAVLGHLPVRGQFAFVPFRNKKAVNGWEVVGIEEYRGVIERMFRAGGVRSVHADVVRAGDTFNRHKGQVGRVPTHEYDDFASAEDRGPLAGVYAYATLMTGGLSQVVWLNRHEVKKHRDASRSGNAFWGPWDESEGPEAPWAPDMWLKTGLHGLERWVPTSAEYRWELSTSEGRGAAPSSGFPPEIVNLPARPPGGDDVKPLDDEPIDAVIVADAPQSDGERRNPGPGSSVPGTPESASTAATAGRADGVDMGGASLDDPLWPDVAPPGGDPGNEGM